MGELFTWANLFVWLGGTCFWMNRMNAALGQFEGIFIIPLCQVVWMLFTVVSGGVYFKEFQQFSVAKACLFALGVICNFIGVFVLQPASASEVKIEAPNVGSFHGEACEEQVIQDQSGGQPGGIDLNSPRHAGIQRVRIFTGGMTPMVLSDEDVTGWIDGITDTPAPAVSPSMVAQAGSLVAGSPVDPLQASGRGLRSLTTSVQSAEPQHPKPSGPGDFYHDIIHKLQKQVEDSRKREEQIHVVLKAIVARFEASSISSSDVVSNLQEVKSLLVQALERGVAVNAQPPVALASAGVV